MAYQDHIGRRFMDNFALAHAAAHPVEMMLALGSLLTGGVFVRFPDPGNDPWNAVNNGYEVQIDDSGAPDGAMIHITGSIYSFAPATKLASNPVGEWNYYEIRAIGQSYKVILNGEEVTDFVGSRSTRGYVGLQDHNGTVTIRNVRIMEV
jgi:hypothetical protein